MALEKDESLRVAQRDEPGLEVCRERIMSDEYADLIINFPREFGVGDNNLEAFCPTDISNDFLVIYGNRTILQPLTINNFSYEAVPNCYGLIDTGALEASGITAIQNQTFLNLRGSGVLLGFIDTGIDYLDTVFQNLDQTTRILGIWDQTIQSGEPPAGLKYGTEYRSGVINEAIKAENHYEIVPSRDENGHGTFIASVAAGGIERRNDFSGAAPYSSIAVVKLKEAKAYLKEFYLISSTEPVYQENDIMFGIRYLDDLAAEFEMPLVICISLGTNMGDHSGSAPLGQYINEMAAKRARAVVVGVGNEAGKAHHFSGKVRQVNNSENVEIRVGEDSFGFTLELWAQATDIFSVSVTSPTGEVVPRIPARSGRSDVFSFVFERTRVYIEYRNVEGGFGAQVILMRFSEPTSGIWTLGVYGTSIVDGTYNIWLPIQSFLDAEIYFIRSNPDITLTEPSCAAVPISTGAYNDKNGSIAIDSGRGFTRVPIVKPEIAAPGVDVYGAMPNNRFGTNSGTSISASITAGAAALLMEWGIVKENALYMNTVLIKNYLIRGATRSSNLIYPNKEWGFGMLDLYDAFEGIRIT